MVWLKIVFGVYPRHQVAGSALQDSLFFFIFQCDCGDCDDNDNDQILLQKLSLPQSRKVVYFDSLLKLLYLVQMQEK